MSYRIILYGLKPDTNGNTILDYSLNGEGILIDNTLEKIALKLDNKIYTIEKSKWVNTMRVYDTGRHFFVICNKQVNTKYVFETLMKYAISKVETRIDFLQTIKLTYLKELSQLKLKAA